MTEHKSGSGLGSLPDARTAGPDAARGLSLFGMMAAGVFHAAPGNGPSAVGPMSAGDYAAVTFALVAGGSLALGSGGCRIPERRHRASARAGIAVQAVLIAAIGLALGFSDDVTVILPYYGLLCLLTILFLACRPWFLARIEAVVLVVASIIVTATMDSDIAERGRNPAFPTLVADPSGEAVNVFVTGFYPVVAYLAYICAGLAIGRLDLSSVRLTRQVLIDGLAIVVVSWLWWLALPASRSHGWVYLIRSINTLGCAMVVVGAALLVVRIPVMERLLRPLTAAGTMALTLYSGYVLVLATRVLANSPVEQYLLRLAGAELPPVARRVGYLAAAGSGPAASAAG